ncbi:MAG: RHS repeat-associated core domain-containing protein [Gemmatimonadota bacterium]|nr:RHS repeat-associated core domain-containing protein [Gemmatimonadota bacterium]
MVLRRCALLSLVVVPWLCHSRALEGQVGVQAQQCGLVASNPCRPGASLTMPLAQTVPVETSGLSYMVILGNSGNYGGTYNLICTDTSTQTTCSPSPATFHLLPGEAQPVTITYSAMGLETFTHTLSVSADPDPAPGLISTEYGGNFTGGGITVSGLSIVQHLWPGDGAEIEVMDTLVATYWHASGINTALTELWIDGVDSSAKLAGNTTSTGYRVAIQPASYQHSWKSRVCANNGRCDNYATTFNVFGSSSYALDDSLPPTVNPLNTSASLLGPLALPDTALWGCGLGVGFPEITFTSPLATLNQSTPSGQIFIAAIGQFTPALTIRTQTLGWLPGKSKACDQLIYLDKAYFDYSYFPSLPPNDPHWLSYPWLSSRGNQGDLDGVFADPIDLAFADLPWGLARLFHGPYAPPVSSFRGNSGWAGPPLRRPAPPAMSSAVLLPSPGNINASTWHVDLNGVAIIHQSTAVGGSGITNIVAGRLTQSAQIPLSHPSLNTTTSGGWNELVASISDSLGHTSSIRVRFIYEAPAAPGSPAPLAIAPQRNFAHTDQGECAAFGAFQCEGITLALGIPGFVTRDRQRGVHLVYRSASQKTRVTVPLQLTINKTQKAPDSLWVMPSLNGVVDASLVTRYFGAGGTVTGPNATNILEDRDEVRIVASELDSAPGEANIRTVTHSVRSKFTAGVSPAFRDDSVSQDVVQLYLSTIASTRFGQGWQLAELGRLVLTGPSGALQFNGATAAIWLSGDGSYTIFRKPGSTWIAPGGENTHMMQLGSLLNGARYVLYLENGARLGFRDDGWQVWTQDLLGNATTYSYPTTTSTQLDAIVDPTGKAILFRYFTTGPKTGYVDRIQVRRSTVLTDTVTVARLDYVTSGTAVRLAKFAVVRTATTADSTRFTYMAGAPGAFIDSIVDPRDAPAKRVASRISWDPVMWTPEKISRPLGGSAQARQHWRRASPRIGYGRPGLPYERTLQAIQWIGTYVPFAGPAMDYQVDPFGGPTYVLTGTGPLTGILGTNSADVRHVVRDTTGRAVRVVHNRYNPSDADSLVYHYDALGRVDTLLRTTRESKLSGQTRALDTLTFVFDSLTLAVDGPWCSRLTSSRDEFRRTTTVQYLTTGASTSPGRCLPARVIGIATDTTEFTYGNSNVPVAGSIAGVRPVKVRSPGRIDSVAYHAGTWNSEYLISPKGAITRAIYDGFGRDTMILDPLGQPSVVIRDISGRVTYARVGTGLSAPVTRTVYDPGGLVTESDVYGSIDDLNIPVPATAQKTFNYFDALGRLDSVINPGGRAISSTGYQARKLNWANRDGFGNPRWDYRGNGSFVARMYDAHGNVTQEDQGQVTSYGNQGGERFADAAATSWWNSLLMPTGKVQQAGITHLNTYDARGRLATSRSRDPFLNKGAGPTGLNSDTAYVIRTYRYNGSSQLLQEMVNFEGPSSGYVSRRYEYNRRGQRTMVRDTVYASGVSGGPESAGQTIYVYDSVTARLTSVEGLVGATRYGKVRYVYDRAGRDTLRAVAPTTGSFEVITRTSYDSLSQIAGLSTANSTGTVHYSMTGPIYNLVGDLTGFSSTGDGVNSGTHSYAYTTDGTRRLLDAVDGAVSHVWTYDLLGNRMTEWNRTNIGDQNQCTSTYTNVYDSDNRLQRRTPATASTGCRKTRYFTDQSGNRLGEADTTVFNPPGVPPLGGLNSVTSYTAGGQLYFSLTLTADLLAKDYNWHWYDVQGRRVVSQVATGNVNTPIFPHPDSVGGFRTYFVYDGSDVALELVRSGSTWSVDRRFLSGGLDRPLLGRFNVAGTYKNTTLVADRTGSILKAVTSTGTLESNANYFPRNAFGALAQVTGTGGVPMGGVGFAGAGTPNARGGFVYLRNRWYDPTSGRFLTQDPLGLAGGVNLYAYAGNNPISFRDPYGLCEKPIGKGVGICIQAFISAPTVMGQAVGDGRGPRSDGGTYKTSHRFSVDPSSGKMTGLQQGVGATKGQAGIGELMVSPVRQTKDGGHSVSVTGNAMSVDMPPGMDITYSFDVNISKDGKVSVTGGEFDGFPSFEIWAYPEKGKPQLVKFYGESNITALGGEPERKVVP